MRQASSSDAIPICSGNHFRTPFATVVFSINCAMCVPLRIPGLRADHTAERCELSVLNWLRFQCEAGHVMTILVLSWARALLG